MYTASWGKETEKRRLIVIRRRCRDNLRDSRRRGGERQEPKPSHADFSEQGLQPLEHASRPLLQQSVEEALPLSNVTWYEEPRNGESFPNSG
jgi:hypothetical protein